MVTRLGIRMGIAPKGLAVTATPDVTPDPFSFTDVTGATQSGSYTSNTITISGVTGSLAVSISGADGAYSKNGGVLQSGPSTAVDGDQFSLHVTASSAAATAVNVVFTAGPVSDTWTVTTSAAASTAGQPTGLLLLLTKAS